MAKCKNIDCNNETIGKRVYCSLTCRNVYVNKHIRDYTKIGRSLNKKDEYLKNPKKCKNCMSVIPYEKRCNQYCNSSCSAKTTNKNKIGIKYKMTKKGLESIKRANIERYKTEYDEYEKNPNKCLNCEKFLHFGKRKNSYCDINCKKEYYIKNTEIYRRYCLDSRFDFNLMTYKEEFDFKLITENGWYSPSNSKKPNLNGVSRDHIFSVKKGFELGINPEIIKHPANCKLMIHSRNIGKGKNCEITIEDLKNKIKKWDEKYKKIN